MARTKESARKIKSTPYQPRDPSIPRPLIIHAPAAGGCKAPRR